MESATRGSGEVLGCRRKCVDQFSPPKDFGWCHISQQLITGASQFCPRPGRPPSTFGALSPRAPVPLQQKVRRGTVPVRAVQLVLVLGVLLGLVLVPRLVLVLVLVFVPV